MTSFGIVLHCIAPVCQALSASANAKRNAAQLQHTPDTLTKPKAPQKMQFVSNLDKSPPNADQTKERVLVDQNPERTKPKYRLCNASGEWS